LKAAVNEAVEEENKHWNGKGPVNAVPELVGFRPAGATTESAPIVQTAIAVSNELNLSVHLGEGSTDSNVPMNLGIPAITIGGGGKGSGAHSLNETYDSTDSWKGTQRALLLILALAQANN
jgi:tripeptide aminopeptidase